MGSNQAAVRHLKGADPILRRVIDRVGPCRLDPEQRPDVFHALARATIYQQLNGRAAGAVRQVPPRPLAVGRGIIVDQIILQPVGCPGRPAPLT